MIDKLCKKKLDFNFTHLFLSLCFKFLCFLVDLVKLTIIGWNPENSSLVPPASLNKVNSELFSTTFIF